MLATKHSFPSDLCISLIGLGASLVIGNSTGEKTVLLQDFINSDPTGYVLKTIVIPLGLPNMVFKTYKVHNPSCINLTNSR